MIVEKGDILTREGKQYTVIVADEEYFVIGERVDTITYFNNLQAYSNDESINTLEELNFTKIN